MSIPSASTPRRASSARGQPHPSGDSRFKLLDTTLKKNRFQPDSLIEVLHNAQGLFGFLSQDVLLYVARALKLPPSRVYGVATFYNFFNLQPQGRHSCSICLGTACYVKGAGGLLAAAESQTGIKAGDTTGDGELTLSTARCLGACGLAPAVVFDGVVQGHLSPEDLLNRIKEWSDHGKT
jgi:bidirectional [NiFe] hydrogenase diaphorase subunit